MSNATIHRCGRLGDALPSAFMSSPAQLEVGEGAMGQVWLAEQIAW
jgi:hypothetical protein